MGSHLFWGYPRYTASLVGVDIVKTLTEKRTRKDLKKMKVTSKSGSSRGGNCFTQLFMFLI